MKSREPAVALGAIRALRSVRDRVDQALVVEVASARVAGCTWEEVASMLGVTRQAAIKKYARHDPKYAEAGPASLD